MTTNEFISDLSVEQQTAVRADPIPGGYAVRDATGQALAYLYSRDNPTGS